MSARHVGRTRERSIGEIKTCFETTRSHAVRFPAACLRTKNIEVSASSARHILLNSSKLLSAAPSLVWHACPRRQKKGYGAYFCCTRPSALKATRYENGNDAPAYQRSFACKPTRRSVVSNDRILIFEPVRVRKSTTTQSQEKQYSPDLCPRYTAGVSGTWAGIERETVRACVLDYIPMPKHEMSCRVFRWVESTPYCNGFMELVA